MITIDNILNIINKSNVTDEMKKTLIMCVNLAYDIGFKEGIGEYNTIQKVSFDKFSKN